MCRPQGGSAAEYSKKVPGSSMGSLGSRSCLRLGRASEKGRYLRKVGRTPSGDLHTFRPHVALPISSGVARMERDRGAPPPRPPPYSLPPVRAHASIFREPLCLAWPGLALAAMGQQVRYHDYRGTSWRQRHCRVSRTTNVHTYLRR